MRTYVLDCDQSVLTKCYEPWYREYNAHDLKAAHLEVCEEEALVVTWPSCRPAFGHTVWDATSHQAAIEK
jgi:hypothetical protein